MENTPKENAYDTHISPLMKQVIALCKEHNINMATQFSLDFSEEQNSPLYCSTLILQDMADEQGVERMRALEKIMYSKPEVFAFAVHTGP